ncbi:MAG: tyrosine-type recombinase/integrase [Hyphomicrobiaceae bacterium]|nr:MAG: tyrosine-type recombinase/integrase [Hyphomicrobiaceae bacterium]
MTLIKLKHIDRFVDRHGKARYYYRAGGRGMRIALPGRPGSPEFMSAYKRAAIGEVVERGPKQRGAQGTFDRLVQDYFSSPEYLRLAPSSQKTYRSVIERLLIDESIGHRRVAEMSREHVHRIISKRAETPGAANSVLQKLKVLLHFAIDNGWRKDDPTLRIKKFANGEFHTWTEEELAQYEKRWPIGTTERLAFALLLYTGQRRSDVVTMLWSDVKDGTICVTPLKTKRRTGVKRWIPIHPALQEVLDAADQDGETTLKTAFGQPFTSNGFGSGFMAVKIDKAGSPKRCVTHGLRKAAARRLAEAGCTANEIAAITGHATLQEVSRYTKAAEQRKLAQTAMRRLSPPKPKTDSQTGPRSLGILPKKPSVSRGLEEGWWSRGESNP